MTILLFLSVVVFADLLIDCISNLYSYIYKSEVTGGSSDFFLVNKQLNTGETEHVARDDPHRAPLWAPPLVQGTDRTSMKKDDLQVPVWFSLLTTFQLLSQLDSSDERLWNIRLFHSSTYVAVILPKRPSWVVHGSVAWRKKTERFQSSVPGFWELMTNTWTAAPASFLI